VEDLPSGVYKYDPCTHELWMTLQGDRRLDLCKAALSQAAVTDAAVVFVLSAVYQRTTAKYGERGIRYVHMEAGHAAQNLTLQATALDLGAVVVGAFNDNGVKRVLSMDGRETPLYLIAVGQR
jgi:SagB-type dehydrogenase family enzyme